MASGLPPVLIATCLLLGVLGGDWVGVPLSSWKKLALGLTWDFGFSTTTTGALAFALMNFGNCDISGNYHHRNKRKDVRRSRATTWYSYSRHTMDIPH